MLAGNVQEPAVSAGGASELADLRQLVAELRQAVRARDDFIASVSHELRNALTPILGAAELALAAAQGAEGTCPPRITVLMERMQHLAHAFIKRTTRLLDVSHIGTGVLLLRRSTTDLSSVVRSVAQSYEALSIRARSPLTLDIQDDVVSLCNRPAVEQVVEYLLSNALKFGSGKPIAVQLRLEGQSARLDIRGFGVGMPPDQQASIFAPFDQVATQHRNGGFGIDLWVANRLVTAMDGRISVSSVVGEGSTLTVMFPLLPPNQDGTTT